MPDNHPALFNLLIPAKGQQHITVLLKPYFDWNKPYRDESCATLDYSQLAQAFTDYLTDEMTGGSAKHSVVQGIGYLQDARDAAKILTDTSKVRTSGVFDAVPTVTYTLQGQPVTITGS